MDGLRERRKEGWEGQNGEFDNSED
ncbi:uncharacterized protein G2W53_006818 [Senna tora]|uniref:Uncharacterized protein n=1 Tax=Senna tora TaxID=362788 RepID=A0A835CED2_9FABA|nr:uncharacterized protein G2W53_006818 [Senna tora]